MNENDIQRMVCDFLRYSYPTTIFRSDFAAGIHLTMGQAVAHKRLQSSRAFPDLQIVEARGNYHGLFIELKRDGTTVYLKNGELSASTHIREQAEMIRRLNELGYYAMFCIGFKEARTAIIEYMELKKTP